jgi:hypothetical protein
MVVFHWVHRPVEQVRPDESRRIDGGRILLPLICTFDSYEMVSQISLIVRGPNFSAVDVVTYILAVSLISGGFLSAVYAWIAALGLYGGS